MGGVGSEGRGGGVAKQLQGGEKGSGLSETEYTSRGMSYRYKIMLHLVHVSYNSRIAIFSVISVPHMIIAMLTQESPCNNESEQENINMQFVVPSPVWITR